MAGAPGAAARGRFAPGTVLDGRYRVTGLLGRGGMGDVYRADDLRLGQTVALKFLPAGLVADARRLAQLHQEVRTARQVAHPNVCRVYDVAEADGHLFLTMEYVDGEDLAASLRRIGRFPEDKAADIARQICAGLSAVHERGIVLRDLKPANIMLDAAGKAHLMDFGLAAMGEVGNAREGTPAYMAPEQIDGREATRRSDLYALGLVLYEVFTGRRAFEAASLADLVLQQSAGEITPPTAIVKHLDSTIERVIFRCLERDAERRPASAAAVAATLPGGDPLVAIMAAGGTPSPELVAAAGLDRPSLTAGAGLAWTSLSVAALAIFAVLVPRSEDLSLLPVEKPRAVLEDRALQVLTTLGARGPVNDTASGFSYDTDFLAWLDGRTGTDRRDQLRQGRPTPMAFWLRTSPRTLVPLDSRGIALGDEPDPPLTIGGMTVVELDLAGRLVGFIAVPPARDAPDAARPVTNWATAFELADLDISTFHDVPSTWTPVVNSDERRAWQGVIPALPEEPLTIEGAANHGAIVQFSIRGPWARQPRQGEGAFGSSRWTAIAGIIFVGLAAGGMFWAWRNYVNGRGDRRGARRVALFVVFSTIAGWAVGDGHLHGLQEIPRSVVGSGLTLLLGAIAYGLYLAAEPFVRRTWPQSLVSWSRLLSGHYSDPLVGRDLLVGTAVGLAIAAATTAGIAASLATKGAGVAIATISSSVPLGWRGAWWMTIEGLSVAVLDGLMLLYLVTAARRLLRRGWVALLVVGIVMSGLDIVNIPPTGTWWVAAISGPVHEAVLLVTLSRLGLVAVCAAEFANELADNVAFSFQWSLPHVAYSWPPILVVVGIGLVGLWMATQTRTNRQSPPA